MAQAGVAEAANQLRQGCIIKLNRVLRIILSNGEAAKISLFWFVLWLSQATFVALKHPRVSFF